ncbi:MAG: isoprenylcysteine carboxylmethyltransferase family protein [Sedimentisphaerales bacterium]|nr:isoprenylcysteine carboxylmethyltransferase family protein [Sedimentisphaerales bacterium]
MSLRKLRIHLLRLAFIPIVFVAVFVRPSWAIESTTAFVMEFGGYLFLLVGLVIRIWCTFYIGSRKSKEIIAEGPYSICRNPLYIGSFLLAIGVGLCFENLLILILVPTIILPVHIIATKMEETHLESKFGEQYRIYKQKVPRFWPRFSNYNSPNMIEVSVHSIRRIAMDTVGVLLLPEIEDLLELLHENGIIPVLWHFPF